MKKIIVLDFALGEVFVYPYDSNIYDAVGDYSEWFIDMDGPNGARQHSENNCQCMIVDELKITIA